MNNSYDTQPYFRNSFANKALLGFTIGVTAILIFLSSIAFIYVGSFQPAFYILILGALLSISSVVLTLFDKTYSARFIISLAPPYTLMIASIMLKSNGYFSNIFTFLTPKFFCILFLMAPIIFFGLRHSKRMIISLFILSPTVLLFDYLHTLFGVNLSALEYNHTFYPLFVIMFSVFYSFSVISLLLTQRSNQLFRLSINTKNQSILSDKEKIEKTNKELKLAIQQNKDYEQFLESSTDIVFMLDKLGKQIYFNKKIETVLGYSKDELIGKSFTKYVPLKEVPKYLTKLKDVFLNKEIKPFETQIIAKNGEHIDVEIAGKLLRTEKGLFAIGSMREISQRLEEKQLLQFQSNLYKILNITADNKKLLFILQDVLDQILGINCLDIQHKGLIFLTNPNGELEIAAHKNVDSLLSLCSTVKKGQCLCGIVLENKKKLFCDSVGHDHTIRPQGMKPHGHYVVPIISNKNVLGVINIYIKQGEKRDENVEAFLEGVANILAKRILAERNKEKLVKKNIEFRNQRKHLQATLSELSDSINYAQFLQKSLMPNQETINHHFKDSSFLFKPKDKVSGDFYFAHEINNNLYFGVGDCTGHGIPGSFLAAMSIEAVKYIVETSNGATPEKLLTELREIAKNRFSINLQDKRSDSMDAAICMYDKKNDKLYYSGGFINLLIVRKNSEIITYKATKCPIGTYPIEHEFELHEIQLEKDDVIYLSSDGYVDQFGYPKDIKTTKATKFKHKRFRELLVKISALPCNEQVKILKQTIRDWRGEIEQIDDITVFIAKH